ncbi:MAG: hypothetical protein ABJL99_03450 [Aliishimia sp.]
MLLSQVSFETTPAPTTDTPLGMDVVCFIGQAAPRVPLSIGRDLATWWADRGYLSASERENGPDTVLDRPVPLRSASDFASVFKTDARLDMQARLNGTPVQDPMPAQVDPLVLVIDGDLVEVPLPEGAVPLTDFAAHIQTATPVLCDVIQNGAERFLSLALPLSHGAGTLAVLAHPNLGFETPSHARARAIGSPLESAVQQFFAMGGRKAYVISLSDAMPLFSNPETRAGGLASLMGLEQIARAQADLTLLLGAGLPAAHIPAIERSGITHLFGLEDAAFVVLPDLPDLVALDRAPAILADPDLRPRAEFADCVPSASAAPMLPLAGVALPVVDETGLTLWHAAVARCLRLIQSSRRDIHLVASLPLGADGLDVMPQLPRSAFLQLAAPFVRTPFSANLPMRAMAADSVLVGQIAAMDQSETPFTNPAARILPFVGVPLSPQGDEAAPVTCITQIPGGATLTRDITTSADPAWRAGGASRLAARLIRLAQEIGQDILFDPIDARLMRRITQAFTSVLEGVGRAGGLAEGRDDRGFLVMCNRQTTTDDDISRGILRADVMFRPASSIEEIRVSLPLNAQRGGQ